MVPGKYGGAVLTDTSAYSFASNQKQPGWFAVHKKTLLTLGGATLVFFVGGGVAAALTGQAATFWSSALGTAAGGMVAVWAAFYFWARDEQRARTQRMEDESAARNQRIQDERDRRQRAINDRSKEVALQILDRAVAVRAQARRIGNTYRDDGQIADNCEWMKAHAALLTDAALRQDLEDAVDMLNPSAGFAQFTNEPYTQRVWPVVNWINELVRNYVRESEKQVERPEIYASLKDAIAQYEEDQEHLERQYQEDVERQIQEARAAQEALQSLKELDELDAQAQSISTRVEP